jgi:hypothetical protein
MPTRAATTTRASTALPVRRRRRARARLGRDPADGRVEQVVQDHHGPLVSGQGSEGLDDGQPVQDRRVRFGTGRSGTARASRRRVWRKRSVASFTATRRTQASGVVYSRSRDQRAAAPGQGLLDDVFGVVEVPGDQVELADQAIEDGGVELVEALLARQSAPSRPRVGGRDAISTSEDGLGFPRAR